MNDFSRAAKLANWFEYVTETGSTNTDLIRAAGRIDSPDALPDFSVLVAGYQTAGRGRSAREWIAPAGSSLFVSVLLRPNPAIAPDSYAWLPLLGGLAMRNAVLRLSGPAHDSEVKGVAVKWPNDVLIAEADAKEFGGHRKVAGVLSELLPDLSGVVVGAGLNLTQSRDQLPVETATSLALVGIEASVEEALEAYLTEFRGLYANFVRANGDAVASGLRSAVVGVCESVGRRVRVILPGNIERLGTAKGIDSSGRLTVLFDGESAATSVAAGDIVHLRHN
ncbi:MAG: biotin--[acetyl-CoA-carboxylase] ligase [Actinomycetales bacterium]|nr:biotin--[acetyl-CoA-carboxylase] ligase [Actinomycetales bacterium]